MDTETIKNESGTNPVGLNAEIQTNNDGQLSEPDCQTGEQQKVAFLIKIVQQKDDLIKLLSKEKNILESEKLLLQREQNAATKQREIVVMRFAVVEKNLLDTKLQLEQSEKREKKIKKECDAFLDKIKVLKEDNAQLNAALSAKNQEHKTSTQDMERLKNEYSSLETKCKWNTMKLKQELERNNVLDKEIEELKNQAVHHQKQENEDWFNEKIDELKANQIMLKHINSEQADRITVLEQQLESVLKELQSTKSLLVITDQEKARLDTTNKRNQLTITDLQNSIDVNVLKVAELQAKVNELEATRAQLSISNDANRDSIAHIESLKKQVLDQSADIAKQHQNQYELLTLNQELSSLNASLQNDILLYKSKTLAMSLENESIKKFQSDYELNYAKLNNQLNDEKQSRAEERLIMAKCLAEKSKECEIIQKKHDQAIGDLDALKKKNSSLVKVGFTTEAEINISLEKIQLIYDQSTTDSLFVSNLAIHFFGTKNLKAMSVTGKPRFKKLKNDDGSLLYPARQQIDTKIFKFICDKRVERVAMRLGANKIKLISLLANEKLVRKYLAQKISNLKKADALRKTPAG